MLFVTKKQHHRHQEWQSLHPMMMPLCKHCRCPNDVVIAKKHWSYHQEIIINRQSSDGGTHSWESSIQANNAAPPSTTRLKKIIMTLLLPSRCLTNDTASTKTTMSTKTTTHWTKNKDVIPQEKTLLDKWCNAAARQNATNEPVTPKMQGAVVTKKRQRCHP